MESILKKIFLLFILLSGAVSGWSQVTIGSDNAPKSGILLDLKERDNPGNDTSDKGFLLPRVELDNINSLTPLTSTSDYTIKQQYKGTIVYNIKKTGTDLKDGLYYWNGTRWDAIVVEMPKSTIQCVNLSNNMGNIADGDQYGNNGTFLQFSGGTIQIPEEGSYAFSFRLYGGLTFRAIPDYDNSPARCAYYISLWDETTCKDIAEINFLAMNIDSYSNYYSYSITLGGHFKKDDIVKVKMARVAGYTVPDWNLSASPSGNANRTSMLWWKL